jgi:hypothetical protein
MLYNMLSQRFGTFIPLNWLHSMHEIQIVSHSTSQTLKHLPFVLFRTCTDQGQHIMNKTNNLKYLKILFRDLLRSKLLSRSFATQHFSFAKVM